MFLYWQIVIEATFDLNRLTVLWIYISLWPLYFQTGQKWLEGVVLYGEDVQRLTFLLHYMTTFLTLDDEGNLSPNHTAQTWADGVLDIKGKSGVMQVLEYHS